MAFEAGPRRCRHSGERSRGFAQASGVHFPNESGGCRADPRRPLSGREVGRDRGQGGSATAHAGAAAADHASPGAAGSSGLRGLNDGLGLVGGLDLIGGLRDPLRRAGLVVGNRKHGAGYGALRMRLETMRMNAAIVPMRMTGMGFGHDRSELNGDQENRRPQNPQKLAGRTHG